MDLFLPVNTEDSEWLYEAVTGWYFLNDSYSYYEAKRQCELKPGGYLVGLNKYRSALLPFMLITLEHKSNSTPLASGSAWIGEGKETQTSSPEERTILRNIKFWYYQVLKKTGQTGYMMALLSAVMRIGVRVTMQP